MIPNKLTKKTFDEICTGQYEFVIPYLQRTYKWRTRQAEAMLDDFREFLQTGKRNYCLQPLAVVRQDDTRYELLDGQQRLTTLLILWRILFGGTKESSPYALRYERDELRFDYLWSCDIQTTEGKRNMDEYYMSIVYRAIERWLNTHTEADYREAFRHLLKGDGEEGKHLLFLWYTVDEAERHTTFAHINSGKIELTCSDLIKALLLSDISTGIADKSLVAAQYAEMEQTLANDRLWYMIQRDSPLYNGARIDLIFNMVEGVTPEQYTQERRTAFYRVYEHRANLSTFWKACRDSFVRLIDLYENPYTYHYIGYLTYIHGKYEVGNWIKRYRAVGLSGVIDELKAEVRKSVPSVNDLDTIIYGDGRVRRILLLHNIQTILCRYQALQRPAKGVRFAFEYFPFELLYSQQWDIEHIASQTDNPLTKEEDWTTWVESSKADYEEVFKQEEVQKLCDEFEQEKKKETFEPLYKKVLELIEAGNDPVTNKDGLGNLVLLDRATNRSYHNALYKSKRRTILGTIDSATFVPPCTANAFLKRYNDTLDAKLWAWTHQDYEKYLNDIKDKIGKI